MNNKNKSYEWKKKKKGSTLLRAKCSPGICVLESKKIPTSYVCQEITQLKYIFFKCKNTAHLFFLACKRVWVLFYFCLSLLFSLLLSLSPHWLLLFTYSTLGSALPNLTIATASTRPSCIMTLDAMSIWWFFSSFLSQSNPCELPPFFLYVNNSMEESAQ